MRGDVFDAKDADPVALLIGECRAMSARVSADVVETYAEHGVVFEPGLLNAEDLREAERIFSWSLEHPSHNSLELGTDVGPGIFFEDIDNLAAREVYLPFLERSGLGEFLSALWGGSPVWYLYEQIFLKQGGAVRRTPWHQDISYMPVSGAHLAVAWFSLDPLPESLEVVRGSHRGTIYGQPSFAPGEDAELPLDESISPTMPRPPVPDIEADRTSWDIASWPAQPGDVLFFHPAALHGGAPVVKGQRRRTLALRFFGEDAIYIGGPTGDGLQSGVSGSFDLVGRDLSFDRPLRHEHFPRLA